MCVTFDIKWNKVKPQKKKKNYINYRQLSVPYFKEKYQKEAEDQIKTIEENTSQQQKWTKTCQILEDKAKQILTKEKGR